MPISANQNGQQVETAARLDKLQLDWPEVALPRCVGVMGRSVFAAASLAVSRFLATAVHLHGTPARSDPRRPSKT